MNAFHTVLSLSLLTVLLLGLSQLFVRSSVDNHNSSSLHNDRSSAAQPEPAPATESHNTMFKALRPDVVMKPQSKHTATLILMHGLGDEGASFVPLVQQFQSRFPYLRCVLPNAPISPVTLNGGLPCPSWHDIVSLTHIGEGKVTGLDESKQRLTLLLDSEIALLQPQLPADASASTRCVIAGFSQGAAMALYTGLQYPQPLGGIVAMAGYKRGALKDLVHPVQLAHKTPVLVCHGQQDQVVGPQASVAINKELTELQMRVDYKTYPHLQHTTSPQELADVVQFPTKHLPPL